MKNKVVIITGGSSGIGKACAFAFGKAGAKVVITGRDAKKLEEVSDSLASQGVENLTLIADVSNERNSEILAEQCIQRFGRIDVLINNAGISMRALFEDLEMKVF